MAYRFFAHACLGGLIALLSACGGGGDDDEAEGTRGTTEKVAGCGFDGDPLRVMPLGDSITEAEAGHNSYRRVLWQRLNRAGCVVNLVGSKTGVSRGRRDSGSVNPPNADFDLDHEGHWDYTVAELLPRVGTLVAQAQPDVVLVHLGTNDVLRGRPASRIAQDLGGLIDAIRAGKPDTHILLAKIIPAAPYPAGTAALNRLIDGIASSRSSATSPVAVVDQASGYSTGDNYDGVHPGVAGEAKLGNRWADAVLAWSSL